MTNELENKIIEANDILKANECTEGFSVRFSGGKDSCVLKDIISRAGYKAKYYYLETTLESDIMANYIRNNHPNVEWVHPAKSVFDLIKEYKMMPTMYNRFCCKHIRRDIDSKLTDSQYCTVLGKRQEDIMLDRKNLNPVQVKENGHKIINPLYNWTDDNIWEYIKSFNIKVPQTYEIYGKSFNCALCIMYYVETKKQLVQAHPEIANKLKDSCFYAWENNSLLHDEFPTPNDYWDWFLNYDIRVAKRQMLNNGGETNE